MRATMGSRWQPPPYPRQVRFSPLCRAATAGQVWLGLSAVRQCVMELP